MSESKNEEEKAFEGCYMLVLMITWTTHDDALKEMLKHKDYLDWRADCEWDSGEFTYIGLMTKQPYQDLSAVKGPTERVVQSIRIDVGDKGMLDLIAFERIVGVDTVGVINE